MGPQDDVLRPGRQALDLEVRAEGRGVDVERVLGHPRGVSRRVVERGEVVVVELDLGPLHHPVAEADEHVLDLALGAHEQVLSRARRRRGARHRDVDRAGRERALELGRLQLGLARARARASSARRAWLAAAPTGTALGGDRGRRSRAGSRSARTCGRGSGPAAPRGRRCRRPRRSPPRLRRAGCRSARSCRRPTISVRARSPPRPRRSAIRPRAEPGSSTAGRSCAASSAGRPSRSRPEHRVARSGLVVGRLASVGDQADHAAARARRARRPSAAARRSSPCSRAPPSASTGRRSPGPSTTRRRRRSACARADDRADVPGIADPVQVDREPGSSPAARLRVDPDHPRPGARASRPRRAARARRPRRPGARTRLGAPAASRPPRPGPRPRPRTAPRARGACARGACGSASASRCPCS